MKTFLHTMSALFAAAVLLMSGPAYADYAPQKVVYHVNGYGEKVQIGALRNIQNHINAVGADKLTVAGLRNQGVRFLVCANTLKGRKVVPDDHLYRVSEGDIVPSGVAELSKLQLEGYTYVKP
jgi:intracellular sulfur oxidation DsrE/DsrF family protein